MSFVSTCESEWRRLEELSLDDVQRDYAIRFASQVVGTTLSPEHLTNGEWGMIFESLSRQEELEDRERDQWNNFAHDHSRAHQHGLIDRPWLDEPLVRLRGQLEGRRTLEPLWPDGRRFALCLTHDVDVVSRHHVSTASLVATTREAWRGRSSRGRLVRRAARRAAKFVLQPLLLRGLDDPIWCYERWLDVEETLGFKSTFFFFPSSLRDPDGFDCEYRLSDRVAFRGRRMNAAMMMREIDRAGWEVGVHGSYHSAYDAELLADEKQQIEDALERPVKSTRQHYLRYDARVTPTVHQRAGLTADSTHGFNRTVGFRAGTSFPYFCWDVRSQRPLDVLEIPQNVMDGGLFHPEAHAFDETSAVRHVVAMLHRVQRTGGVLTLNWHPNYLTIERYWNSYRTILREAHALGAWGCSVGALNDWWRERSERIASSASQA